MKIKCMECGKEMELEVEIKLGRSGCEFCKLSSYQRTLIHAFLSVFGKISELTKEGIGSHKFIIRKLDEITMILEKSIEPSSFSSKQRTLDDKIVQDIINEIPGPDFTTFPDFINGLSRKYPDIVAYFESGSPRNWRARIGRRLSQFEFDRKSIKRAGRKRNSQVWTKLDTKPALSEETVKVKDKHPQALKKEKKK